MLTIALAFLIGVVAGLRSLTAPALVSWAARFGWLHLQHTWLAFLGAAATPYVLSALAIAELINDKLPRTPRRTTLLPFVARVVTGALCGAALGISGHAPAASLVAGALGAVAGTLGGYEARTGVVRAIRGKDLPIALIEDAIAVFGAAAIVFHFS